MQQRGGRPGVSEDAGDVGGGGKAADPQPAVCVADQLAFQVCQVDVAVAILADDHEVSDRLAPGQLVGVMLVRADEDHRPLGVRDAPGQLVPLVQPGRDAQFQDADELVHRGGDAGSAEDDEIVIGAADGVADDLPGLLAQPGSLQPGARAFGVRVGVPGEHRVPDEVLDEIQ